MPVVSTLSSSQRLSKETLVDVALDLGRPPVLHERKPGDREVSRRKLKASGYHPKVYAPNNFGV